MLDLSTLPEKYWLIFAGGKVDCTTKIIPPATAQAVVDALAGKIQFVQVGSAADAENIQPKLNGVIDLVGQTSVRDYFRLVYHAQGVLCGITSAVHVAAALGTKCVVVAGAREFPRVSRYPSHAYLEHEIACKGCWAFRVAPLDVTLRWPHHNKRLCMAPDGAHPTCMTAISPERIAKAVQAADAAVPVDGVSVLIRTDGRHADLTRRTIDNIKRAMSACDVPSELIIAGHIEPFAGIDGVRLIDDSENALAGRIGAVRNVSGAMARYGTLVFLDDDIFVPVTFLQRLVDFSAVNPWNVLGCRLLYPDGSRYYDRAVAKLVDGKWSAVRVPYDHDPRDPALYQTGGITMLRREVFEGVKWDSRISYPNPVKPEDTELCRRLQAAGYALDFDPLNTVWHATGGPSPACAEFAAVTTPS